ncbi:BsuPI-related putative proteinase inhibitor [Desertibacillus haloalkaliphilus]|uniref:BsuPI-related putative proteinase inhibitor n=1 Tax=Desertibacillus haloalkaliphilus TaxID=1328930 RepID=UPI001C26FBA5|nr:BsuPI-related putative proteinase inhibitor [Desertibacillus haloalkaliphilus]MBU8908363.1 hypothetical protein [Desertibacillus haloalkaliphilus]
MWVRLLLYMILMLLSVGCGTAEERVEQGDEEMKESLEFVFDIKQQGEDVQFLIGLRNTREEDVELEYISGQQFEITVVNPDDEIIYRFSEEMAFTQVIVEETLLANDEQLSEISWKVNDVPSGTYKAVAELLVRSINGEEVAPRTFQAEQLIIIEE